MPTAQIISASRIFTGTEWVNDCAVVIENGLIKKITPAYYASPQSEHYEGGIIAPAFIDLQIYGANEKLFAVYPEEEALEQLVLHNQKGGTAYCLPTLATNELAVFYKGIDALRSYWKKGGKGVLGLHLEGPWINPVKRGAHIESLIHPPVVEEVQALLEYGKNTIRMITLAPECCDPAIVSLIRSYGVVVSAGHSNATYEEAKAGFANGIRTVTHLYNAMSPLQHRGPGLVGAVLDDEQVMSSIIPDGHHVDYAAIRIAKSIMKERLFVITDAVTTTTAGHYPHQPAGDKYESGGILSGSALTMNGAVKNLVAHCNIELTEALRMCSLYPARVMGLENQLGCIRAGYEAKLVVLDEQGNVKDFFC